MKTRFKSKVVAALSTPAFLLAAYSSFAGGPLNLNAADPDNVERWPSGGAGIPFNIDGVPAGGPGALALGTQDWTTAYADVVAATGQWAGVASATNTYSDNGPMPFDIDATNFAPFIQNLFSGTNISDGFSPIALDVDGSIFLALFGSSGVLGFASTDTRDAMGNPIEAVMFLNGGAINGGFPIPDFQGVEVHEFGHYTGLAHTVTNGESVFFGDQSGPTPSDTFGPSPINLVETMYPFAGNGIARFGVTPHADDIAILSFLYPDGGFFGSTATITGTILAPNSITPLTGVNVIARNVANPFVDANSSISGDRGTTGVYTINGLTPGATYNVFVDQILAGGFSTPFIALPGPEEFHSGAAESNSDVDFAEPVSAAAGATASGVDVIFNSPQPGDPLQVGDDGFVELFLPFTFDICGQDFDSVFVNANGSLTFGEGDTDFTESTGEFLDSPPRIAGVWDDLSPFNLITGAQQGLVTFNVSKNGRRFTVSYTDVPEFLTTGSNTFSITLRGDHPDTFVAEPLGSRFVINYGDLTVTDGLGGYSCGNFATSSFEEPRDLSEDGTRGVYRNPAIFELFGFSNPNDLANSRLRFARTRNFEDLHESQHFPNDSLATATHIHLPFDTISTKRRFSEIDPDRSSTGHRTDGDVDYYEFNLAEGQLLTIDLFHGGIDSIIGLFDPNDDLIAVDDDGQGVIGGLSIIENFPITASGKYTLAVSTWPDFDFDGLGGLGGEGRYVMDIFTITPPPGDLLTLPDDGFVEVSLDFSFPYQGNNWNSVFVNSNGNLTFGSGDTDFSESVGEFLNDQPRIAPLWDDLNPAAGGFVSADGSISNEMTVYFQDVPEFIATGANSFSVTMRSDGTVTVSYTGVDSVDSIVGVTPGGGLPGGPGAVDLSTSPTWSATGTTYEQFSGGNPFDLDLSTQDYNP